MNKSEFRILLVDDEPDILEILSYNLNQEGYQVRTSANGKEGIEVARKFKPHLILLDVMMPGMDGIETCEHIRAIDELKSTVVAFLTARAEDYSQVAGFEAGADDYIAKPFKQKVLSSRIKALLKRHEDIHQKANHDTREKYIIHCGDFEIHKDKYVVYKKGLELSLPKKEFELLVLLISKPDTVITREKIFGAIWGSDVIVGERTIDVHIRKLRKKLGDEHIITVKGVGYKFKE
jgi:two-component system, OmpR family, alkaline phosphatase synthesis response regulator PhoP